MPCYVVCIVVTAGWLGWVGEGRGIGGRWKCCSCLQLVARNSAADTPERCRGRLHITVITLTTHQLHVRRQRRLLPTPGRGKFRVNRFVDKGLLVTLNFELFCFSSILLSGFETYIIVGYLNCITTISTHRHNLGNYLPSPLRHDEIKA